MSSAKGKPAVRVLSHRRVYDGKILSLELDEIQEEGGTKALREVVRHRGSVAAIPVDDEVLEVKWYTLDAARGLLHAGEIKDAKTVIALLMESEQRARKATR